jgi:hypothetical protein
VPHGNTEIHEKVISFNRTAYFLIKTRLSTYFCFLVLPFYFCLLLADIFFVCVYIYFGTKMILVKNKQ